MSHSKLQYSRLSEFVFARTLNRPNDVAWYLADGDSLRPISYQLLGACLFLHDKCVGQFRFTRHRLLTSSLPNCMTYACLDLACNALDVIHATLDLRLSSSQREYLIQSIDSEVTLLTPATLADLFGLDQAECINDSRDNTILSSQSLYDREWQFNIGQSIDRNLVVIAERLTHTSLDQVQQFAHSQLELHEAIAKSENRLDEVLNRPATILHTSGSTLHPKTVVLSNRNLISNAIGKLHAMPQYEHDRRLNLLPFAHAYARTCELSTWAIAGGSMMCILNLNRQYKSARSITDVV